MVSFVLLSHGIPSFQELFCLEIHVVNGTLFNGTFPKVTHATLAIQKAWI